MAILFVDKNNVLYLYKNNAAPLVLDQLLKLYGNHCVIAHGTACLLFIIERSEGAE